MLQSTPGGGGEGNLKTVFVERVRLGDSVVAADMLLGVREDLRAMASRAAGEASWRVGIAKRLRSRG
jgi:hypothetical protein